MAKAKFLIPMKKDKDFPPADENGKVVVEKETKLMFPTMEGKYDRPAVRTYTDWKRLRMVYEENVKRLPNNRFCYNLTIYIHIAKILLSRDSGYFPKIILCPCKEKMIRDDKEFCMINLKEDFNDILANKRVTPVFQPIVSLRDGTVMGYEAFSRIVEPQIIKTPGDLFKLAGIYGRNWELEQLCRSKIFAKYNEVCGGQSDLKLFINVNPMVIHDKEFQTGITGRYLQQYDLDMKNIVFEITEQSAVDDMKGFRDTIRHYMSQGYHIAVDNAGACYSGLNLICDIVPHYLKLDYTLIHDIHKDTVKCAMVKSLVEFGNLTNIHLVAEGIETEEELKTLMKLGVHFGQGFYLREPDKKTLGVHEKALKLIQKYSTKQSHLIPSAKSKESCVMLFELTSTKAYRAYCSKYGDASGEAVLKIMKESIDENLSDTDVLSVMADDTMVAVMAKENHKIKCETILSVFKNRLKDYYSTEDWENDYIESTNKHGEWKQYPIIGLHVDRVV